jgi:hypothetical protein
VSLEIADGPSASRRFLDTAFGNLPRSDRAAIRSALEACCRLDNETMIAIVQYLERLC